MVNLKVTFEGVRAERENNERRNKENNIDLIVFFLCNSQGHAQDARASVQVYFFSRE